MKNGYFITVEGGEGSGKSTVIKQMEQFLIAKGFEVVSTREPGGIKIAEQIRSVILDKDNTNMDGLTEACLFAASRRQHLVEKVIPALKSGKIVLCDRFIDSSLAYQGYARGLGIDKVMDINSAVIEDCMPNLTILLDISPEVGLERIYSNNRNTNRLDLEGLQFHKKIREGYSIIAKENPNRIVKMDASGSPEIVLNAVCLLLEKKLAE